MAAKMLKNSITVMMVLATAMITMTSCTKDAEAYVMMKLQANQVQVEDKVYTSDRIDLETVLVTVTDATTDSYIESGEVASAVSFSAEAKKTSTDVDTFSFDDAVKASEEGTYTWKYVSSITDFTHTVTLVVETKVEYDGVWVPLSEDWSMLSEAFNPYRKDNSTDDVVCFYSAREYTAGLEKKEFFATCSQELEQTTAAPVKYEYTGEIISDDEAKVTVTGDDDSSEEIEVAIDVDFSVPSLEPTDDMSDLVLETATLYSSSTKDGTLTKVWKVKSSVDGTDHFPTLVAPSQVEVEHNGSTQVVAIADLWTLADLVGKKVEDQSTDTIEQILTNLEYTACWNKAAIIDADVDILQSTDKDAVLPDEPEINEAADPVVTYYGEYNEKIYFKIFIDNSVNEDETYYVNAPTGASVTTEADKDIPTESTTLTQSSTNTIPNVEDWSVVASNQLNSQGTVRYSSYTHTETYKYNSNIISSKTVYTINGSYVVVYAGKEYPQAISEPTISASAPVSVTPSVVDGRVTTSFEVSHKIARGSVSDEDTQRFNLWVAEEQNVNTKTYKVVEQNDTYDVIEVKSTNTVDTDLDYTNYHYAPAGLGVNVTVGSSYQTSPLTLTLSSTNLASSWVAGETLSTTDGMVQYTVYSRSGSYGYNSGLFSASVVYSQNKNYKVFDDGVWNDVESISDAEIAASTYTTTTSEVPTGSYGNTYKLGYSLSRSGNTASASKNVTLWAAATANDISGYEVKAGDYTPVFDKAGNIIQYMVYCVIYQKIGGTDQLFVAYDSNKTECTSSSTVSFTRQSVSIGDPDNYTNPFSLAWIGTQTAGKFEPGYLVETSTGCSYFNFAGADQYVSDKSFTLEGWETLIEEGVMGTDDNGQSCLKIGSKKFY